MDTEAASTKKIRRNSGCTNNRLKQFRPSIGNDIKTTVHLTILPDELLLAVFSYLNIVDMFRAFHGLNRRFDNIIYDSARHITLPSNATNLWLEQHMPQLEHTIKTICLNAESLNSVFANNWSFPNLRSINLQGKKWNISLRIREKPVSIILMSSLHFLQNVTSLRYIFSVNIQSFIIDVRNCQAVFHNDCDFSKTALCPFIERLSIRTCSLKDSLSISTRAPNLTYLKINNLGPPWYTNNFVDKFDHIKRTTNLVTLNLTAHEPMDLILLKELINSCKTSLKRLILKTHCLHPLVGYLLESIVEPCEQLEKFEFFFQCNNDNNKQVNIVDCQRSFQSTWWLNARRPSVYIQHNDIHGTIIASIPCQYSFAFENDLYNWYFNKGDRNSSLLRFTNVDRIHLTNNIHQSISLEYLYFIDRIFTSSNQCLCFDFCDLELVDILFELLMDDTSIKPVLPKVKHFIVGSENKLDSLMLLVWILLAPSLQKLDISNLTTFNKLELSKEMSDKIDSDERLKSSFDHINELIVFSEGHNVDIETKNELLVAFQKVFTKADIH